MNIEVYADGSATTTGKPGGYGYVVVIDGVKNSEGSGYMPSASNNDAELEAAIQGLISVYKHINLFELNVACHPNVTLVCDSQLILGWASGHYKFKQSSKMEKFHQLSALVRKMSVKTRWVRGHSGDEHNERCDKLAGAARLSVVKKAEIAEAVACGETAIGSKKAGILSVWYKGALKVIDLDNNVVENYSRDAHGTRGSIFEVKEEKFR